MPDQPTHRRSKAARLIIGRVAHIHVVAHPTWFFGIGLLSTAVAVSYVRAGMTPESFWSWLGAALAATLFYPFVLVHELAHARAASVRGVETSAITLHALGASSETLQHSRGPKDELAIAVAGPVASIALGLAGVALHGVIGPVPPWSSLTAGLAAVNFGVAVLGLFPVFPSDGARILGAVFWRAGGAARGHTLVRDVSRRSAFLLLAVALTTGLVGVPSRAAGLLVVSALFALGARRAQRAAQSLLDGRRRTVGEAMVTEVVSIPASLSLAEVERQFVSPLPYRVFPVLRGDRVVGILRRQDVLRQPAQERDRLTAQAIMIRLHAYLMASPADDLSGALSRLHNRAGCVVVVDDGRLRGLLTSSALDRAEGPAADAAEPGSAAQVAAAARHQLSGDRR
jgi:CBS domain-containing protein/Zn-dependent protease